MWQFLSVVKKYYSWGFFPYNILTFRSSSNMVVLAGSVSGLWICRTIFLLHKTKCSLCNVAQRACWACTRSCFQSSAFIKQAHWPTCNSGTWEVGTRRSEIQGHPWLHGGSESASSGDPISENKAKVKNSKNGNTAKDWRWNKIFYVC